MKKSFTFTLDGDVVKKAKNHATGENLSLSAEVEKLFSQDAEKYGEEKIRRRKNKI